jgi:hypothetical protein
MVAVCILRFRGDRIAHEALYVMDGFEAPEWRREWATMFDPLASVSPDDRREGVPFGFGWPRGVAMTGTGA